MANAPKHSVSVAGIVTDENDRVLVIRRRDNNHWEPPGGVLELHETFEQGLRREILEETGVTVTIDRLTGVYKNLNRGVVALVFRGHADTLPRAATAEAAEIRWMTREEITEAMDPAYAVRVLDAFEPNPQTRAHNGVDLAPNLGGARVLAASAEGPRSQDEPIPEEGKAKSDPGLNVAKRSLKWTIVGAVAAVVAIVVTVAQNRSTDDRSGRVGTVVNTVPQDSIGGAAIYPIPDGRPSDYLRAGQTIYIDCLQAVQPNYLLARISDGLYRNHWIDVFDVKTPDGSDVRFLKPPLRDCGPPVSAATEPSR